jgi:hypothetical protein
LRVLFVYHEYYKRHKKSAKIVGGLGHDVVEKELKNKSIANQVCKRLSHYFPHNASGMRSIEESSEESLEWYAKVCS